MNGIAPTRTHRARPCRSTTDALTEGQRRCAAAATAPRSRRRRNAGRRGSSIRSSRASASGTIAIDDDEPPRRSGPATRSRPAGRTGTASRSLPPAGAASGRSVAPPGRWRPTSRRGRRSTIPTKTSGGASGCRSRRRRRWTRRTSRSGSCPGRGPRLDRVEALDRLADEADQGRHRSASTVGTRLGADEARTPGTRPSPGRGSARCSGRRTWGRSDERRAPELGDDHPGADAVRIRRG